MTKKEYLELQEKMIAYADAYYNQDSPVVSDEEYDALMRNIKEVEKEHPEWVDKSSITQVIGGSASTKFSKVEHDVPMLSIEDVFDKESVKAWIDNVSRVHPDTTFSVEEKIDGLSCTLRYKWRNSTSKSTDNGDYGLYELVLAETRGNGIIGEDVTENVMQIDNVPHSAWFPIEVYGDEFQVRGEIYMTKANFERYNKLHPEKPAANARNLAAGTLRQKDASLVKERGLSMFIFNVQKVVGATEDLLTASQCGGLHELSHYFSVVTCKQANNFKEADGIIDMIESYRNNLGYDIDGAVIKINEKAYQDDFKGTAKYTAGHIAYKYPQSEKRARLLDVEVGVGRTGKLSFTGVVCDDQTGKPLQLCGTEVSRVTLNNMDYIRDNHIGIGGVYGIIKSGEIIPKLTGTVYKEPGKLYEVPDVCPFCGEPIVNHGAVDYFCDNEECTEKNLRQLEYFCGRNQMNIDGISAETIRFLIEYEFIDGNNPAQLYYLANEFNSTGRITDRYGTPLDTYDGWSEVSIKNMVDAINRSRNTTFDRVMVSLGIPNIGHGQVKLLKKEIESVTRHAVEKTGYDGANNFDYFQVLMNMYDCDYDFSNIEGFGSVIIANLKNWIREYLTAAYNIDDGYNNPKFKNLMRELNIAPVEITIKGADTMSLDGLTFCCTGSVTKFKNRDELYAWIENLGGKTTSSVSKKTSYLINNDANLASSKNKKARELGIPIITEEELLAMRKEK